MQYFLFHPVLANAHSDSKELLRRYMCIGDSFSSVLELGAVKLKAEEMNSDEMELTELVMSAEVMSVDREHNAIIEKIVRRFGWDLTAKTPDDEASASMIACLLKNGRFDILEHLVLTSPVAVTELAYTQVRQLA